MDKKVKHLEFEQHICELFFPGRSVTFLSINLDMDVPPQLHVTMYLDNDDLSSILTELKRYNIELTPKDEE